MNSAITSEFSSVRTTGQSEVCRQVKRRWGRLLGSSVVAASAVSGTSAVAASAVARRKPAPRCRSPTTGPGGDGGGSGTGGWRRAGARQSLGARGPAEAPQRDTQPSHACGRTAARASVASWRTRQSAVCLSSSAWDGDDEDGGGEGLGARRTRCFGRSCAIRGPSSRAHSSRSTAHAPTAASMRRRWRW